MVSAIVTFSNERNINRPTLHSAVTSADEPMHV